MNRSGFFWGLFFVTLGTAFLLMQFNAFDINVSFFTKLWPLFLIFLGLTFLKVPNWLRNLFAGASGFLVAMFIVSVVTYDWNIFRHLDNIDIDIDDDYTVYNYQGEDREHIDYDSSIKHVELDVDAGAMKMDISGGAKEMIEFNKRIDIGKFNMKYKTNDDLAKIDVDLGLDDVENIELNNDKRRLSEFRLNNDYIWSLDLDVGASKLDCDLSENKISELDIDAGAAKIILKLGEPVENTNVKIDCGAASVDIYIPESIDCVLDSDIFMASQNLQNFEESDDYFFHKGNKAGKMIRIDFSGALGNLNVKTYKTGKEQAEIKIDSTDSSLE